MRFLGIRLVEQTEQKFYRLVSVKENKTLWGHRKNFEKKTKNENFETIL